MKGWIQGSMFQVVKMKALWSVGLNITLLDEEAELRDLECIIQDTDCKLQISVVEKVDKLNDSWPVPQIYISHKPSANEVKKASSIHIEIEKSLYLQIVDRFGRDEAYIARTYFDRLHINYTDLRDD